MIGGPRCLICMEATGRYLEMRKAFPQQLGLKDICSSGPPHAPRSWSRCPSRVPSRCRPLASLGPTVSGVASEGLGHLQALESWWFSLPRRPGVVPEGLCLLLRLPA